MSFTERPYQSAALEGTRVALRKGARSVLVQMPTGCHARGQQLLRADGAVLRVEDVAVGERLMGPDLTPRHVLALHRGRQEMVRIVPRDGEPWVVNMDHVLTLAPASAAPHISRDWIDITVRAYMAAPFAASLVRCHTDRVWDPTTGTIRRWDPWDRGMSPIVSSTEFALEPQPEDDFYGFELDGDSRYLLADGTVTHNSGKSHIFRSIIRGVATKGKRALLLVQGQNLVRQAAKHLSSLGFTVGVEMGDEGRVGDMTGQVSLLNAPQIVVASKDTIIRRLDCYPRDFFRMIVNDECHHSISRSNLTVFEHFGVSVPRLGKNGKIDPDLGKTGWRGDVLLVGLTATPDRGDGGDLRHLFEEVGFKYGIMEAIDDGWLVPIEQEFCHLEGLDLQAVRKSSGDLDAAEIERIIRPLLEPICKGIVETADGRPTLIYNPLVTMAEATTMHLGRMKGAGKVVTVTGETKGREDLFAAMARKDIWALSSVGTLTEGVDIPCASVGAMLRFTLSRPLYAQIMGRILRPAENIAHALNELKTPAERRAAIAASSKPKAVMLDFVGNSGKHKLIHVLDVIGEDADEKLMNLAKGHSARGVTNPFEALRRAEEDLAKIVAGVTGTELQRVLVDPFAMFSVRAKKDPLARPPTDAQIEALLNVGAVDCKITDDKSREKARKAIAARFDLISADAMLAEAERRVAAMKGSMRQVRRLVKHGLPVDRARDMSFREARLALDDLARLEWRSNPGWITRHSGPARAAAAPGHAAAPPQGAP